MGASVQFYGINNVMQAAENLNSSCWGIYINNRLFCKYEDTDMSASLSLLQKNLEVLQQSNSTGVYTLKFFECEKDKPVKINDRSICDAGSFNFKLIEPEEREQGLIRAGSYNDIAELKKEFQKFREEMTEEVPEPETIGSVVIDLLKRPNDLAMLVNVLRAAVGMPIQNLGMITGIRTGANESITEDQKIERLAIAMDKLEKHDPDLMHHLEKLSVMSEENPDNFKLLLTMLGK